MRSFRLALIGLFIVAGALACADTESEPHDDAYYDPLNGKWSGVVENEHATHPVEITWDRGQGFFRVRFEMPEDESLGTVLIELGEEVDGVISGTFKIDHPVEGGALSIRLTRQDQRRCDNGHYSTSSEASFCGLDGLPLK